MEQEGLPGFFGQTFKQPGDSLEYLQRSVNGFRAGNTRLVGMQRQRIQISAFDLAASGTVDQQTGGRGRQKSARLLEVERLGQGKNSNESVMSKIGCTLRAAQFFPQPVLQPRVVVDVELGHLLATTGVIINGGKVAHTSKLLKHEKLSLTRKMTSKSVSSKHRSKATADQSSRTKRTNTRSTYAEPLSR
ncbi:Membrane protein involved in ER to Golgi transport [Pseudomonas syringae pv. actinidiae]|uniref:Membrane protein involved in ER to Golgi transport n=1 Tax=Pseudomonas syringae pv. actinidiae TaxID=103796 RepID=A0AAN4Q1F2_PSESF|nr:Membrane protein involved in ER to Golgi transport [Pseudomonas syringae pv. actinidiae]